MSKPQKATYSKQGARTETTQSLGSKIREARREAGLNAEQLAVAAGIGYGGLVKIEQGRGFPRFDTFLRLSIALGLDPAELLPDTLGEDVQPEALDFLSRRFASSPAKQSRGAQGGARSSRRSSRSSTADAATGSMRGRRNRTDRKVLDDSVPLLGCSELCLVTDPRQADKAA
jgi:transcriptional regulator with XRE-family HTH domain